MTSIDWAVLNLAYVVGLLLTAIPGRVSGVYVGEIILLLISLTAALIAPRVWKTGPKLRVWLGAGIVGCFAVLLFHFQIPQPAATDISRLVVNADGIASSQPVAVEGQIETPPRLTRSQRIQFQLKAKRVSVVNDDGNTTVPQSVNGKLYVTVPLLTGTGLYPGQPVVVSGSIYKPKPAVNPGGFDFQAYLAQEGIFAGLNGRQVNFLAVDNRSQPLIGKIQRRLWQIRRAIVRSQVDGLGVPEGPLVSAMLLGGNAVDVPYELQDSFAQAGLAHAIAASGFQVSALIAIVVALTRSLSSKIRLPLSVGILCIYIGLTGLEPSVLRAGLMGIAALIALTLDRKVKPLGSVLLAATLLLLFKPIWIWDLGFQLSFLATLGLLITVPVLTKSLDWVPSAIAPLVAVPVAAYIWTLPLQLLKFGVVSPYSIFINIVTAPLITVISIGSGISALIGLLLPGLGSTASWFLFYPTYALITLVEFVNQLPGNAVAIGTISVSQAIALYGLYGLVWWQSQTRWRRYVWVIGVMCLGLVTIPAWHIYTSISQVTVLATSQGSTLVIQDKGKVILVGNGSEEDVGYTVLPFLKGQGINRIDLAIAPDFRSSTASGWFQILKNVPIRSFFSNLDLQQLATLSRSEISQAPSNNRTELLKNSFLAEAILMQLNAHQNKYSLLVKNQQLLAGSIQAQVDSTTPFVLRLKVGEQHWLMLENLDNEQQQTLINMINSHQLAPAQVLWWAGGELSQQILEAVQPTIAIASAKTISTKTETWLQQQQATVYLTGRDGSIQWSAQRGFMATLAPDEGLN